MELVAGDQDLGARLQPFGADTDTLKEFEAHYGAAFVAKTFVENAVERGCVGAEGFNVEFFGGGFPGCVDVALDCGVQLWIGDDVGENPECDVIDV